MNRYMLKIFNVDPSDLKDGIVTKATPLYPYYSGNHSYIDKLNEWHEYVKDGKPPHNRERIVDENNKVVRDGVSAHRGASGLGWFKEPVQLMQSRQIGPSYRETRYFKDDSRLDHKFRNSNFNDVINVLPSRRIFDYDYLKKLNDGVIGKNTDISDVLMLVEMPEEALVTKDDVINKSWQGARDDNYEVQTKLYRPIKQITSDDFIKHLVRPDTLDKFLAAVKNNDGKSDRLKKVIDAVGSDIVTDALNYLYAGDYNFNNEHIKNYTGLSDTKHSMPMRVQYELYNYGKYYPGYDRPEKYVYDKSRLLDIFPYDDIKNVSDECMKNIYKDMSNSFNKMKRQRRLVDSLR